MKTAETRSDKAPDQRKGQQKRQMPGQPLSGARKADETKKRIPGNKDNGRRRRSLGLGPSGDQEQGREKDPATGAC